MYWLKGFVNIDALANNTPGSVAALGELSNISLSYSIEKGYFNRHDYEKVEFVSFTSKKDTTVITAPAKYTDHIIKVAEWMYDQALAKKFTDDEEAFRVLLLAQYGSEIADFECGKMVTEKGVWLPSYIAWKYDLAGEENLIRVWFSDAAFKAQYDDYQIVVVPPIEPVDTFQLTKAKVAEALAKFTVPDLHERVLAKTKGEPYTYLVSKEYPWYDHDDTTQTLSTTWTVAIYGIAGNNLELIKDAIAKYILANSTYDRDDWIPIFPDIFTNTEFTFIPFWNHRSVVDETYVGSLYSPIVPYDGLVKFAQTFVPYVTAAHLTKYIAVSGIQYKSLACAIIGGVDNRNSKFKITDFYPDLAQISTTSIDFNRMTANTVEFLQKLLVAIIAAEEMDEYSYIGASLSRITRNGMLYVGFSHGDVGFLVLSRSSQEAKIKALKLTY